MQDIQIIYKIESLLGIKLRVEKDSIIYGNGYYVQDNNVVSIGLDSNELSDINFPRIINDLRQLKKLTQLSIRNSPISDIIPLEKMNQIRKLDLSMCPINEIKCLKNLKHLTELSLRYTNIYDFTVLAEFNQLEGLSIESNGINDISFLKYLTQLKMLSLERNQISDISSLKGLRQLSILLLGDNLINNITPLKDLRKVVILRLSHNQISDITPLKNLEQLQDLILESNRINDITPLKNLRQLTTLNLRDNNIEYSPLFIFNRFEEIVFESNSLRYFNCFNLGGNPIKDPPVEIIIKGKNAIMRYFERKEEEAFSAIKEGKLIFVGEGAAGKTSLKLRLQNPNAELPKGDERTRGIDVTHWKLEDNFVAHIWDFGGQDVYYPVHRFFITDNAVFILLASTRNQQHNFEYWIPTIYQFGGDSPILIGQTCHEGNREPWNDLNTYQNDSNFNIIKKGNIGFYRINLPSNNEGLEEIRNEIIHQIKKLPHFSKEVPESWIQVRNELKNNQQMCIHYVRFKEICKNVNAESFKKEEDISDCCLFLHNIGSLFWYHQNTTLKDWVVLKPELAVEAVYKIIDDNEIKNRFGHIIPDDFKRLWSNECHVDYQSVLKEMLKEFKVAFSKQHDVEMFILPALLDSMPLDSEWSEKPCIKAEFEYNFMPKALVNQLSAVLSTYIPLSDKEEVWNNAVNFIYENTAKCQVKEDFYRRKITIKASGKDARSLMILVMDSLKLISSAYKGVEYDIMIPCICEECEVEDERIEKHPYNKLMRLFKERGREKVYCNESGQSVLLEELVFNVGLELPTVSKSIKEFRNMKRIKIFLASSKELKVERGAFEVFINRENKRLHEEGIFLHLDMWEDFLDAMSLTRLQDEYNKAVKSSDIFVSLFFSKVGKYTEEEFEAAYGQFIKSSKPHVYTFFKKAKVDITEIRTDDFNSLNNFKKKLKELGHYPTEFKNIDDLENQFRKQIDKLKGKI